jgi:hypothetical protein
MYNGHRQHSENIIIYAGNNAYKNVDPLGLLGFGLTGSISGELGLLFVGEGGTASAGFGIFGGESTPLSLGGYVSGGAFEGGPGYGYSCPLNPDNSTENSVTGGFAGAGGGIFITNANAVQELRGAFNTYTYNLGIGPRQASIQFSEYQGTWIVSFTTGPGFGVNSSTYHTYTKTTGP